LWERAREILKPGKINLLAKIYFGVQEAFWGKVLGKNSLFL